MSALLAQPPVWAPLLVGLLSPLLTAVVQQPHWSNRVRVAIGAAAAVVLGGVTALADGSATHAGSLLATVMAVLVASQTAYHSLWKPAGFAQAIEVATSGVIKAYPALSHETVGEVVEKVLKDVAPSVADNPAVKAAEDVAGMVDPAVVNAPADQAVTNVANAAAADVTQVLHFDAKPATPGQ